MLKWTGLLFLLLGLIVLGVDAVAWLSGGEERLSALGEWWFWIDKDSLQVLQPAVERHLSPALWDPGIQTVLEWSLALELMVIGLFLNGLSRFLRRTA